MSAKTAAKAKDADPVRVKQEARRSDVANAALAVIAKVGLEGMSMRAIAAEMQCTTGVLTHYFRDKKQLVRFVLDWMNDDTMARFNGGGAPKSIDQLADNIMWALPHDPARRVRWLAFLNFTVAALNEPDLAADEQRRDTVMLAWLKATLDSLAKSGVLAAEHDMAKEAEYLLALVDGFGLHTLTAPGQFTEAKVRGLLLRHLTSLTPQA